MLVLITYDVNTEDAAGRRRLRQMARQCVNYGQRVQNSVFECFLDPAQCRSLQAKLCRIMDLEKDSLRFYYLGNRYENKIEHFGAKTSYLPEDTLILRHAGRRQSAAPGAARGGPERGDSVPGQGEQSLTLRAGGIGAFMEYGSKRPGILPPRTSAASPR